MASYTRRWMVEVDRYRKYAGNRERMRKKTVVHSETLLEAKKGSALASAAAVFIDHRQLSRRRYIIGQIVIG